MIRTRLLCIGTWFLAKLCLSDVMWLIDPICQRSFDGQRTFTFISNILHHWQQRNFVSKYGT